MKDRNMEIYEFGTAPKAKAAGYDLVCTVHSTEQDLRLKHASEDLIFVYGPSVQALPGAFEFARFERKVKSTEPTKTVIAGI
jgi:hypothetical protein